MEPSATTAGPSQTSTKIANWRVPFIKYLTDGTGYSNRNENERLIHRSRQYLVVEGKLWRKNAKAEVLMKCIEQEDGIKLLEEIHSGTCGNHAASWTLVGKCNEADNLPNLSPYNLRFHEITKDFKPTNIQPRSY
jgi:hypothetical protein